MIDKEKLIGHLAVAGAYTIFGFNIIFCKDIANSHAIDPAVLFSIRAIGASALFWLISLFLPKEKVALKDMPQIALASALGLFIPQFTFLEATTMTSSIDLSVLGTLPPVFTMCFAAIFLKEPITAKKAGGVALSLAGILMLIFNSVHAHNGTETQPLGIVLMLVNGISFGAYLGIFRPLISRYSVVAFMKWMFLFSLLYSIPFAGSGLFTTDYAAISAPVVREIAFLVIFATFVAYFLIPVGQKRIRPTLVSMYTYLQPMIATVFSIIIGMDTLNWQKVTAIILVITGVTFVNRSRAAGQNK
jgi:drug/metabolite transporter (DMT)-like permease